MLSQIDYRAHMVVSHDTDRVIRMLMANVSAYKNQSRNQLLLDCAQIELLYLYLFYI